jgi:hypothetical protein
VEEAPIRLMMLIPYRAGSCNPATANPKRLAERPLRVNQHNLVIVSSIVMAMQHEQKDRAIVRAARGVAYAVTGAYVGAILFLVTAGIIQSLIES